MNSLEIVTTMQPMCHALWPPHKAPLCNKLAGNVWRSPVTTLNWSYLEFSFANFDFFLPPLYQHGWSGYPQIWDIQFCEYLHIYFITFMLTAITSMSPAVDCRILSESIWQSLLWTLYLIIFHYLLLKFQCQLIFVPVVRDPCQHVVCADI